MNVDANHKSNFISQDEYLSITEINQLVKTTLEMNIGLIQVQGEVSSLKYHSNGHLYLTLKDHQSTINAIIFKNMYRKEYQLLKIGDKVTAKGSLNIYTKTGQYNLNLYYIAIVGAGSIYQNFLLLKKDLEEKGLFNTEHKKPLPENIKKLAIITSLNGAAIGDFLKIYQQQNCRSINIIIIPTLMQGDKAHECLIESLQATYIIPNLDVILITRGGGAYEDLECFNNKDLAYQIHKHNIPIITAIGHEQDFTIADFIADVRASTPSHAAELLSISKTIMLKKMSEVMLQLYHKMDQSLQSYKYQVQQYHPQLLYLKIKNKYYRKYNTLSILEIDLNHCIDKKINHQKYELQSLSQKLDSLNPIQLLNKGFVLAEDKYHKKITTINNIRIGDSLSLFLKNGLIQVEIKKIDKYQKESFYENYS